MATVSLMAVVPAMKKNPHAPRAIRLSINGIAAALLKSG